LATAGDCAHGKQGGALLHPESGEPWCLDCRTEARRDRRQR
jgi:hypothetical protein